MPPGVRCAAWAEIDLAAIERNLRLIRASLPPHMRYVAVVKADAYGHGMHQRCRAADARGRRFVCGGKRDGGRGARSLCFKKDPDVARTGFVSTMTSEI